MNLPKYRLKPGIDLPGYSGWPWVQSGKSIFNSQPEGRNFPTISIITPSFNQVQYIEETIRSVLLQGYPNLEYIIIDGGSTDGSVEIIKDYEPWLTYWVSEPDRGQSHAILKGFTRANGEIMAWINSDDLYAPGALIKLAETAEIKPKSLWFAGRCDTLEEGIIKKGRYWGHRWQASGLEDWYMRSVLMQPGVFWKKELWLERGGLEENLHYSFDYELWLRFAAKQPFPYWINHCLAFFRSHSASKTSSNPSRFYEEDQIVRQKHAKLWQEEPTKTRLKRLKKLWKSGSLIRNASTNEQFNLRLLLVWQAIFNYPTILLNPVYDFKIVKALMKQKVI